MRRYLSLLGIAAGLAFTGIACAGGAHTVDNDRRDQAGAGREAYRVSLKGCVAQASSGQAYVLQHVYVAPPAEQPIGGETIEHAPLVARGSWVRLADQSGDLHQYLGKQVSVVGDIVEAGENTIGTSGSTAKDTTTSTVPPQSDDANGNAPLVAVEHLNQIADSCGK